jgi:hypothetical protein
MKISVLLKNIKEKFEDTNQCTCDYYTSIHCVVHGKYEEIYGIVNDSIYQILDIIIKELEENEL